MGGDRNDEEPQETEAWISAQLLIDSRRNISPKRLVDPGPSRAQLESLLALAAAAPDHGMVTPWRFVLIPFVQRRCLAEVFAMALADRDRGASVEQFEAARQKAFRAPLVLVAAACLGNDESGTPRLERMISMGAAIQNVLLGAHAMGFAHRKFKRSPEAPLGPGLAADTGLTGLELTPEPLPCADSNDSARLGTSDRAWQALIPRLTPSHPASNQHAAQHPLQLPPGCAAGVMMCALSEVAGARPAPNGFSFSRAPPRAPGPWAGAAGPDPGASGSSRSPAAAG